MYIRITHQRIRIIRLHRAVDHCDLWFRILFYINVKLCNKISRRGIPLPPPRIYGRHKWYSKRVPWTSVVTHSIYNTRRKYTHTRARIYYNMCVCVCVCGHIIHHYNNIISTCTVYVLCYITYRHTIYYTSTDDGRERENNNNLTHKCTTHIYRDIIILSSFVYHTHNIIILYTVQ